MGRAAWRWFALQSSLPALHRQEGAQQHLEVAGTAMQAHLPQGAFCGLHHRHHQADAADHGLPVALRRQRQGGLQLL